MTAAFDDHVGPWTVDDVEALPHRGDHARYELLSPGVLTVSPASGLEHQGAAAELFVRLRAAARTAGADVVVLEAINVELDGGRLVVPDIAVVDAAIARTTPVRVPASAVSLVVKIVSPGSEATDRYVKPRLYGAAGVGGYWRFELEPEPRIVVHELRVGQFVESAVAMPGVVTAFTVPFPVELDPAELVQW